MKPGDLFKILSSGNHQKFLNILSSHLDSILELESTINKRESLIHEVMTQLKVLKKQLKDLEKMSLTQTPLFLFGKDGRPLTLYEIAKFWQEIYPEDIFISEPKPIIKIRNAFKEILEMEL